MKKTFLGLVVGLLLGMGAAWFYLQPRPAGVTATGPASAAPAAPEKPKDNPLHLTPAKRAAAGITLAQPTAQELAPEVTVFGRVLDATALVTLAAEWETAKVAYDATSKELERVKKLFANNNNASAQTLETVEAAASRDHAAQASARVRLVASWGARLADEKQLAALIDALASGQSLVRLDVLTGDVTAAEPKTARVGLLGSSEMFDVKILGPAPMADPQIQGAGFLALAANQTLPVGATLRGTIAGKGEVTQALAISRDAVIYHQGSAWVYTLDEEDTLVRKLVTLGRTEGDKIALTSGLEAGQQVVVTGAQQLLAAELQAGEAPEEP